MTEHGAMADDDDEDLDRVHGYLNRDADPASKSGWNCTFRGGPMDGANLGLEIPPTVLVRSLQIEIGVGPDEDRYVVHGYELRHGTQYTDPERGVIVTPLEHVGEVRAMREWVIGPPSDGPEA